MKFSEIIKNHKSEVFPKTGFHQQNILSKIEKCRTPELGSHLYVCDECQSVHLLSNSCGNRNCPVCQGNKRKKWIEKQCNNLINVPYFHVVFTVSDALNSLFLDHPHCCYNILFQSAWSTLKDFFYNDKNLHGSGGMITILHTWGQTLSFHPHLHCLVPAAGINQQGELKLLTGENKFLFNVKNLSKVFRAKFAENLTKLQEKGILKIGDITRKLMFAKKWVVYSQKPFSTPENVVRYIGMYSHRVAISEKRIISDKDGFISFNYKDYKDNAAQKVMTLSSEEFLRRFSLHILPSKFRKIRYYGQLNNRKLKEFLQKAEQTVGLYRIENHRQTSELLEKNTEFNEELDDFPEQKKQNIIKCPSCKTGYLHKIASFSGSDIKNGIMVVNLNTGTIVYKIRDGPDHAEMKIINIQF